MIRIAQTLLIMGIVCLIAGTHYGSPVEGDTSDAALVLQWFGGGLASTGFIQLMTSFKKLHKLYEMTRDRSLIR